jgi:Fe2+ transport system protein FeoA
MLNLHFLKSAPPINPALISKPGQPDNLSQASSGQEVTIAGFGELSAASRQHLQAYGLLPGRRVRVLAQRPVTIVLIEQTELAFETEIAAQVLLK